MNDLFRRFPIMVCLLSLVLVTSNAKAACSSPEQGLGVRVLVPFVGQSAHDSFGQSTDRHQDRDHDNSIVGLWHVAYTLADGTPFYQSFKFWHSDGTEWESANASPLLGNICIGVWKKTDARGVRLHHVGWDYENAVLIGTITLDELNVLANDGQTYKGTFAYTTYDLDGHLKQQIKGTLAATRINVDDTGPGVP